MSRSRFVAPLAIVLAVLAIGCTPLELRRWKREYLYGDRQAAVAHVERVDPPCRARCMRIMSEERPRVRRGWGLCRQWMATALDNGWQVRNWETMNWVMHGESRCDPNALSPAGAIGLMQVMPFWADDCGGWPSKLYEPAFNLRCARHVWRVQGWDAWDAYD